ncbi:hypothetical protein MFLO_13795 [Listeria floridensis FSL S10-1187]|uniref:Uncharacterized protein n=1 Tax=Listeria floridensis FSL S10-1187 TaxID=1265817 RepID=A0ABN0RCA7_9LIST|nr:hypothetical protein MFLO_13795 [Listeria floridensis FSL S10-1187]
MNLLTAIKLFFSGLALLFILQLLSYINWLLVDQQVITGYVDKYIFLKTPLVIIPILFFVPLVYCVIKRVSSSK